MAHLIWTGPAIAQLDAIASYIALDKPDAAKAVVQRIMRATDHVPRFTKLGRPIPEYSHPAFRQVWLKPCWVYYRIDVKCIYVVHVRRGERLLRVEDLFLDENDPA